GVLNNCTLTGNSATYGGGASHATVTNCILYGNSAANFPDCYQPGAMDYCCTSVLVTNGRGNFTNAPLFLNQGLANFHLQSNSPCINSGANSDVIAATD